MVYSTHYAPILLDRVVKSRHELTTQLRRLAKLHSEVIRIILNNCKYRVYEWQAERG